MAHCLIRPNNKSLPEKAHVMSSNQIKTKVAGYFWKVYQIEWHLLKRRKLLFVANNLRQTETIKILNVSVLNQQPLPEWNVTSVEKAVVFCLVYHLSNLLICPTFSGVKSVFLPIMTNILLEWNSPPSVTFPWAFCKPFLERACCSFSFSIAQLLKLLSFSLPHVCLKKEAKQTLNWLFVPRFYSCSNWRCNILPSWPATNQSMAEKEGKSNCLWDVFFHASPWAWANNKKWAPHMCLSLYLLQHDSERTYRSTRAQDGEVEGSHSVSSHFFDSLCFC